MDKAFPNILLVACLQSLVMPCVHGLISDKDMIHL